MVFLVPVPDAVLGFLDAVLERRWRGWRCLESYRDLGATSPSRLS